MNPYRTATVFIDASMIYQQTYTEHCNLNRKDRRTAHGRVVEQAARIIALEAELEYWRSNATETR